ncbi:MAG: transcription termination factor Rho [Puniceicoccaceae bacterium]
MSDENQDAFVPGPIDVSDATPKPKAKRTTTRKKAEAPEGESAPKPVRRGRKKADDGVTVAPEASDGASERSEKGSVRRSAATKKKDSEGQRQLLFSSDEVEAADAAKERSEKAGDAEKHSDNGTKESAQGSNDDAGSGADGESNSGNRQGFSKGNHPHFNKGNKPNKGPHGHGGQQGQMSNRKKKQQQWKQKHKQQQQGGGPKKGKKDRFKIDGLNADIDNSLELGQLPEWETIQSESALASYIAEQQPELTDEVFAFDEAYTLPLDQLREAAQATGEQLPSAPNRKQLIERLLSHAHGKQQRIELRGILEVLADGNGLLTYSSDSYRLRAHSAFVPAFFIKKFGLLRGHELKCRVIPPVEEASCPLVVEVLQVQGMEPEKANELVPFTEQIPYYPTSRIFLESDKQEDANKVSMRVVDLISPIGFGQRGLIVAPPRTGKTVLMQGMANSIQRNYPDAHLIILLIDERPEEVTDFRRRVKGGEVISSTFDENAESHVHAAEMVIEKSRRMVEAGKDVIILLDSITRLARAYNTVMPNSGKILSGGVEANALQKPKRFFGSARNIEGGGSLTIIATALVETGSKMDEVIFEEFKGTGNMELHLDRALVDKRVFPSLSMEKSGTRKEELLYHPDELQKIYGLRRAMKGVPSTDAMEMLISKVKKTGSNAEFLMTAAR